jgi:hypothetical protein
MSDKPVGEKTMLTQAYNGRKPGSLMEWGEAGIRASLKARRARARKPDSPNGAARNMFFGPNLLVRLRLPPQALSVVEVSV